MDLVYLGVRIKLVITSFSEGRKMSKIVVIEDSTLMRMRITRVLNENGYHNITGFNSADTIGNTPQLYLNDVDLIITDIRLPGMNGIEFTTMLKTYPDYCNIPIVFVSGHSDIKTINNAINAGAVEYIVKPFDNQLFIEKIKKIIGEPSTNMNEQIYWKAEGMRTILSLECERAMRGKQPLSFIKLTVKSNDIKNCFTLIKKNIRKIDMVYIVDKKVLVVLPLTGETAMNVVVDKLDNQINEQNIEVLEKMLYTYIPDSHQRFNDFLERLL